MEDKTIVVIPSYEPDEKLICLLKEIKEKTSYDIIIVNDGSSDSYNSIFDRAEEYATVLQYPINKGKGVALKTAFAYIKSLGIKCNIITSDGDGQHLVKDIINVSCSSREENNTITLGVRNFDKDVPFRSRFGNNITTFIFKCACKKKISDTQTGLRCFSSDLLDYMLQVKGERYEYETNMLLKTTSHNIEIKEVPIDTVYIEDNRSSHFHVLRDSYRIYKEIIKFSCSSFCSFLLDYLIYSMVVFAGGNILFANIFARIISSTFNFYINRKYVFKSKENLIRSYLQYFALVVFLLIVNSAMLELLVNILEINKYVSKVLVEMTLFIVSLIVQKTFIFSKKKEVA